MYKLLLVADERIERELLYEILQLHMGDLCKIYEVNDERETMHLLNNNWEIKKADEFDSSESISEIETEDRRLLKHKQRMERYIQKHYMEEISVYDVAEKMNYCKLFKQCFGINFTSYLAKFRIKEAKKMLETPKMNVKEIGKACGYSSPCYFARIFKRETGCTPVEYRNRFLNDEIE